jgi:thiol-disulfide isomerase/thioredoxin
MQRTIAAAALVLIIILVCGWQWKKSGPVSFTFYYLPGCKWCEEAKPAWKRLEKSYSGKATPRNVDANSAKEEVSRLGINSFPAYILFDRQTGHSYRYEGDRTDRAFRRFLSDIVAL